MKNIIAILTACLFPFSVMAQNEDPHVTGNVPITFYGKVVDQNNQPVSGVGVALEYRFGYFTSPTTGKERWAPVSLTTDTNGDFILAGVKGGFLQFTSIEKEGYKLMPAQVKENFMYYPPEFHPDPANPVVFKMWKEAGKEPLVVSTWHGKIACDGTPVDFDVYHGYRSTNGSLEITCSRTPLNYERTSRQPYDYKFEIALSGGGIQPAEDDFTYLAPEDAYSQSVTIERKAGAPQWVGWVKQEFYIKTVEGHYGLISVEWEAGHRPSPTPLKWDCSINPSGSRNLER
jgi:hypothetical protein